MCIRDSLKGIAAKLYTDGPKTVRVDAVGPCEVTADNIKQGDDIETLNPEWHIATLGEGGKLVMELTLSLIHISLVAFYRERGKLAVIPFCPSIEETTAEVMKALEA